MELQEIAEIIAKDTGSSGAMARRMAEQLTNLHQDLQPVVDAYLSGKPVAFSLGTITLQTIMDKENCSVVEALFSMSTLLENPDIAAGYSSMRIRRGCLEG